MDLKALLGNLWSRLPGMGPSNFTFYANGAEPQTAPSQPTPQPTVTPTSTPVRQPAVMGTNTQGLGGLLSGFTPPDPQESILKLILQASQETGIDPSLLAGILAQESLFNPQAIYGQQGNRDRGIAQISERWHPEVADPQALDPNFAVPWAARKLKGDVENFGGNYNRGIAAYNVGRGGANIQGPGRAGLGPKGQSYLDNVSRRLSEELINQLGLLPSQ